MDMSQHGIPKYADLESTLEEIAQYWQGIEFLKKHSLDHLLHDLQQRKHAGNFHLDHLGADGFLELTVENPRFPDKKLVLNICPLTVEPKPLLFHIQSLFHHKNASKALVGAARNPSNLTISRNYQLTVTVHEACRLTLAVEDTKTRDGYGICVSKNVHFDDHPSSHCVPGTPLTESSNESIYTPATGSVSDEDSLASMTVAEDPEDPEDSFDPLQQARQILVTHLFPHNNKLGRILLKIDADEVVTSFTRKLPAKPTEAFGLCYGIWTSFPPDVQKRFSGSVPDKYRHII